MEEASRAAALATAHSGAVSTPGAPGASLAAIGAHQVPPAPVAANNNKYLDHVTGAPPPCKRPALFDDEHRFLSHLGVPSARLKMTTQSQYLPRTSCLIGPILCHALSLLLWTSILHCHSPGVATVARRLRYSYSWLWLILIVVSTVATHGEWQCKIRTGGVWRLAMANGPNIFQMLLVDACFHRVMSA